MSNPMEDPNTDDNLSDSDDLTNAGYVPISPSSSSSGDDDDDDVPSSSRPNGAVLAPTSRLRSMSLENGGGFKSDDGEEEEEREREREEAEIERAFAEDERRRSARLTEENTARVMEAMRGVSFSGLPPAWTSQLGEDRWASRLRQLRERRS